MYEMSFFPKGEVSPSAELRKIWCDPTNTENPFSKYIGNDEAVKRLNRAAFAAFGRYNHCCSDQNYAVLGPASTGKTTLIKMFAELLQLPFVEISAPALRSLDDLLIKVAKVLEGIEIDGGTLELEPIDENVFVFPPMIIFIDEVHDLASKLVQGLLKATEKTDNTLITESNWIADTQYVCWAIATTDRGLLFDAFDTRFTKINLRLYSLEEIAKIIKLKNPDFTDETCNLVAKFGGRVPREAMAFAKEIRLEKEMNEGTWEECARVVAADNGIDEWGMTHQRVAILSALAQGPISRSRMVTIAGCKEEELIKFTMPTLLAKTPDQNPLVTVTSRGYMITPEGMEELTKRGMNYKKTLSKTLKAS